jgi:hypothetical protein
MMVEAIMAILLLGTSMAAISALMTQHIRQSGTNNLYTTAISLGERELDDLRSLDYNSLASRTSTVIPTPGSTTYTITSTIQADTPIANAKQISTTVTWTGLYGSQSYSLYTIFTALQR